MLQGAGAAPPALSLCAAAPPLCHVHSNHDSIRDNAVPRLRESLNLVVAKMLGARRTAERTPNGWSRPRQKRSQAFGGALQHHAHFVPLPLVGARVNVKLRVLDARRLETCKPLCVLSPVHLHPPLSGGLEVWSHPAASRPAGGALCYPVLDSHLLGQPWKDTTTSKTFEAIARGSALSPKPHQPLGTS